MVIQNYLPSSKWLLVGEQLCIGRYRPLKCYLNLNLRRKNFWEKGSSAVLDTVPLNGAVFNIYLPLSRRGFWEKGSFALFDATAKVLDNKSLTCVKSSQQLVSLKG
jgi:hypothetical protein